jgi:hypothetical protein
MHGGLYLSSKPKLCWKNQLKSVSMVLRGPLWFPTAPSGSPSFDSMAARWTRRYCTVANRNVSSKQPLMESKKDALPPVFFEDVFEQHHRVAWRIEVATPDPRNPLLEGDNPWDDATPAAGHGSIMKDPIDGKFKGWTPVMSSDSPEKLGECEFRLAYIESDDGVKWRRPELDLIQWEGKPTNLIFDNDSGGRTTFASVFVYPEASPNDRYEMFCFREVHWRCPARCVAGFNQTPAKDEIDVWKYYGLYRYKSQDGIHWRPFEGPLKLKTGDACYVYRDFGGYVAHFKMSAPAGPGNVVPRFECAQGICRVTSMSTSEDGTNWSAFTPLVSPDINDNAADQIMEVNRYRYGDGYVGLVTMYHSLTQRMDLQFSASPDGRKFWRPIPRSACLPNPPLGDYGGGMIWPFRTPIEHDGRLYVYYGALSGLHGDVYKTTPDMRMFRGGALCRASWDLGRFYGLVNSDGGGTAHATTMILPISGNALYVNALTKRAGEIRAELLDAESKPIQGFTKEESDSIRGDHKFAPLKWKGKTVPSQDSARIRFYIKDSVLYGYTWK